MLPVLIGLGRRLRDPAAVARAGGAGGRGGIEAAVARTAAARRADGRHRRGGDRRRASSCSRSRRCRWCAASACCWSPASRSRWAARSRWASPRCSAAARRRAARRAAARRGARRRAWRGAGELLAGNRAARAVRAARRRGRPRRAARGDRAPRPRRAGVALVVAVARLGRSTRRPRVESDLQQARAPERRRSPTCRRCSGRPAWAARSTSSSRRPAHRPRRRAVDDAATRTALLKRFGYRDKRGCGKAELCPAFSLPDLFRSGARRATPAADRGAARRRAAVLLPGRDHARPAHGDAGVRHPPHAARAPGGGHHGDARPRCTRRPASTPSSPACRCWPPRPTPRSSSPWRRAARRCSPASPPSRSCCSLAFRAWQRALVPLRADRAGDRLVGARALRPADPAEPDVGRRSARSSSRSRPSSASCWPSASGPSAPPATRPARRSQRTYRSTGAAVLASGTTAIAGFAVLVVSDIRMLRDFGFVTVVDLTVALLGVHGRPARGALLAEQRTRCALRGRRAVGAGAASTRRSGAPSRGCSARAATAGSSARGRAASSATCRCNALRTEARARRAA